MMPFDPGGAAPDVLADGQPMAYYLHRHRASFGEFGSAQVCARREFFCPRGLKEGILLEAAGKRVLHSTYRATFHLAASTASKAHFPSVLKNTEDSRRNIKASDGSICFPVHVGSSTEGQGLTRVDCLSRVHNKIKRITGRGDVQQEQENSSYVSTSFDGPLMLSNHPGAASLCLSKSLRNNCHSTSSKFTSLQALHIPRALPLHISCDAMWKENEFCIEDPEDPSPPDLRPEVRAWDCEALCNIGADQMPPADNILPTGANDMVSGDNPCYKDTDDAEENCCIYMMDQTEESVNSKKASKILDPSAHTRYTVQWLFHCLMISPRSIFATPNNKMSPSQFLHTLRFLQRFLRLLKQEGLNCEGDVVLEQSLADIQIFPQVYKPRLISDHDQKAMEASRAACYSKQLACKQVHLMVKEYTGRNGHHQKEDMKMIVQERVLVMLQVFLQRYLHRRSGNGSWLRCLYLEQDIVGDCELQQYSSMLSSKVRIVSVSTSPNLLETENGRLPRITELSSLMMHDFEENVAESYGSSSWSQENGSIRVVEEVNDRDCIPIEQVGECVNTCGLHLQAHPSAFPPDLTKLLDLIRNQPEALNLKCSNGNMIDEVQQGYTVCAKDDRHEASCLPMSAVDGPCSFTLPQCSSNLAFSMEGSKSCTLHGGIHERQSREKLEHFAEVFLLRRHIIQQQRRAQQAPPFPCMEFSELAADDKGSWSTGLLAGGKPSPYSYSSTNKNNKCLENRDHEPTTILTSSVTKPCDVTSSICDHDNFEGADIVIDIVGLVKYLESRSSQLETLTDAAANSIGCTHMPFTGGQLVIPNVNAMIVTIVAIVVYTRIFLEGALAWVGSRTQRKEKK